MGAPVTEIRMVNGDTIATDTREHVITDAMSASAIHTLVVTRWTDPPCTCCHPAPHAVGEVTLNTAAIASVRSLADRWL